MNAWRERWTESELWQSFRGSPLAIAASFDLASVAFEPVLHSTGRARYALFARLAAVCTLGSGIFLLYGFGAEGVAWAVAIAGAVSYLAMGGWALRTLLRNSATDARQLD